MITEPRRGSSAMLLVALLAATAPNARAQYAVKSPDGKVGIAVRHDRDGLTFTVTSGRTVLVDRGALGITTNRGEFASGLRFVRQTRAVVNETYRLPVGKRSTYVNHAHELDLDVPKGEQELHVVLRAYDDGIAFRYVLPGTGDIEISSERHHLSARGHERHVLGPAAPEQLRIRDAARPRDRRPHLDARPRAARRSRALRPGRPGGELRHATSSPTSSAPATRSPSASRWIRRNRCGRRCPFASPWRFVIVSPGNVGAHRRVGDGRRT